MPELRIFDALDQLRQLSRMFDLPKLLPAYQRLVGLFDGVPDLSQPGAADALADEFMAAAAAIADATVTDRDDALVDGLGKIANDPTFRPIIVSILEWLLTQGGEPERMPFVDAQSFTAAGIDFAAIVEFFKGLVALYKAWKGLP